jgi:cell surface protein SprA
MTLESGLPSVQGNDTSNYKLEPNPTDQNRPQIYFNRGNTDNPDSTRKILKMDSVKVFSDSSAKKSISPINEDSIRVAAYAKDSTARIQNFHYVRHPLPVVTLGKKYVPGFYVQPTPGTISRKVEIDSTGKFVLIREEVSGVPYKTILRIPLDEYIDLQMAANEKEDWNQTTSEYELKSSKKELGQLIKDITDFEIPLPSVGVLSIFGEPKISLKIGGAVDIHGAWRNETTEGLTASFLGNTKNEPDFRQTVQVNVDGTIGDKLNIKADWNTERTFQYENQLKIKYTGYEDEIIQSVEAGNVSLQTSPLVGGSEALFGLKAQFKLGPFTLTTLASQKKGEVKEVSINSGSTSSDFSLRAYDYSINHYFVDTTYASEIPSLNLFYKYYGSPTPIIDETKRIVQIEVWRSVNTTVRDKSKERQANAFINLPPLKTGQSYDDIDPTYRSEINPIPGQSETGRFILLQPGVDYELHPETGFITFKTQVQDQDIIAVSYQVQNNPSDLNDDDYYGEFLNTTNNDTTGKLVLKLVKPANLQPQMTEAWKLLLKNIYPVGGRNIKKEGFEFNIKYEKEGQDPVIELPTSNGTVKLLNAFGLDNVDQSNNPTPDDIFDYRPGITILPSTGEIIFPMLQPFGNDFSSKLPDSLKFQSVYDTTKTFARQNTIKDKWELVGKYSGEASSVYQLGFNVVENSVRVYLNGALLKEGSDYLVDYTIGQVTIRNDAALVPGADLKITFEQNDLFQLASKTLLGARGVLDISDKTKLGFSVLNLNQQTLSDKVRIGEEPLSNTIYGVDFSTSSDLPFVTKLLDNIISTKEMSTISLSGEYAYMKPDPNTKKSTIPTDNGESVAYVDDFEGSKRIIPIGVNYTAWKDLSPPVEMLNHLNLTPRELINYKAKSFWFTFQPPQVSVHDIWGDRKQVARSDQQVPVLDFVYIPDTPGTYNYYPTLQDPTKNWGGMMTLLSSTANNLVEENIEYIEFWMFSRNAPSDAKIYIDLGRISEDVIPNNVLDTEDKNFNDVLEQGEDTGIDGLTDSQEGDPAQNPNLDNGPPTNGRSSDPSGDNFALRSSSSSVLSLFDYYNINGTEGNAVLTDRGRIPDTEDLNRNGNLDKVNSFFRYEVPIDTNLATNKFAIAKGGGNGWFQYRIPLKDTTQSIGSPSFSNVESIRIFTTGETQQTWLRLAEFNLVGNQWQKVLPQDTTMSVSVINIEDNQSYTSPPGVYQLQDKTRPDENVLSNEQSLDLIVNKLPVGESREAVRYFGRPLDVFNYSEMKLFVHGDEITGANSVSSSDLNDYNSEVYIRFGTDTNNFYEYRQPVRPGWTWNNTLNDMEIKFSELTAIKEARDSINAIVKVPVPGKPYAYYSLRGNPTLTSVRFVLVGIYNKGNAVSPGDVSGEIWLNELRVIGADNHPGWAYSMASSMKLADLANVNFNITGRSPYFHQLSDRFGSRVETRNWSISTTLDVLKLLPIRLSGSNLKLNYSHTETLGKPLYLPGTDVLVSQAAQQLDSKIANGKTGKTGAQLIEESKSLNISDSWSASNVKIKIPGNHWWLDDTFNSLTLGFAYNKTYSQSPTVQSNKSWVWNATMNYGLNLGEEYYFKPADIPVVGSLFSLLSDYKDARIYYLPQNISWNIVATRTRNTNIPRPQDNSEAQAIISRDFTTTRTLNFNWKLSDNGFFNITSNYNLAINSSLANLEVDKYGEQRPESAIWGDIFSGKTFGQDFRYQQSIDFRSVPRLPSFWDINKYFTITAGYSSTYQWGFDFRQQELGRSAGISNRATLGLTLRWKALTAPLFENSKSTDEKDKTETSNVQPVKHSRTGRTRIITGNEEIDLNNILKGRKDEKDKNSLVNKNIEEVKDTTDEGPQISPIKKGLLYLETFAKSIFFDYENITFNFSSENTISKSGLRSRKSGFNNFWGFGSNPDNGPSRSFMLGLDPYVGPRAPNGNLEDVFAQRNSIDFGTSRPLWKGAKIDLKWQVGWSINKTVALTSDANGNTTVSNLTATGTLTRSFLSFPPVLFLKGFKSGIAKVHELYNPQAADPVKNLSQAFVQGFESFPTLSKLGFLGKFINYIPRPNWHITWDGLENLLFFKKIADNISLDHAYSATYTEGWLTTPDGSRKTQIQRVQYGFLPLVGLNLTFGKVFNGVLISSIKYSTRSSFDLGISTRNIIESFSKDIGITAGYSKSGFELPLFGVALKNDIEFSFSYTYSKNSSIIYDMRDFKEEGTPQNGTTRITIEPRVKYTISSRVQLSIFYSRTKVNPEGASRIPATVTNQAGLDVHISIQ